MEAEVLQVASEINRHKTADPVYSKERLVLGRLDINGTRSTKDEQ